VVAISTQLSVPELRLRGKQLAALIDTLHAHSMLVVLCAQRGMTIYRPLYWPTNALLLLALITYIYVYTGDNGVCRADECS
jgi:hypothetical protein